MEVHGTITVLEGPDETPYTKDAIFDASNSRESAREKIGGSATVDHYGSATVITFQHGRVAWRIPASQWSAFEAMAPEFWIVAYKIG